MNKLIFSEFKKANTVVLEYQHKLEDCQAREAALQEELSNQSREVERLSQTESQCQQTGFENEVLRGKLQSET